MKSIYKNSFTIVLSMLIGIGLAMPANAQHNGGGGGGGSRPASSGSSGGGGGSRSSSGGSSVSSARPSSGMGYSRPSTNISAPVRSSGNVGTVPRGNYGYAPRTGGAGNYGYAPRAGVNAGSRQGVNGVGAVRGNYGMAPRYNIASRGAVSASGGGSVNAYRTAPRVGYNGAYGHGGGYWGNHGYNYYNRGYYNSYYLPRLGFSIGVLPYGYYPFYFGDYQYYYSDGLYYQYDNNQYTVVEPPVGAEVTSVPDKAQSIVINGQQYYELNGVYYQAVTKDDGTVVYQIAGKDGTLNTTNAEVQDDQPQGPQMGDVVVQLPQDCRKVNMNGQKLYVSPDGVYYQQQVDANGAKSYKVVGLPSDEPAQN